MRKLVTIRKISEIFPIQGADRIECATVDGWNVVVKNGEFKCGDYVLYFEIDSWVPHDIAPFLSKNEPRVYNGISGERLRTIRLRGQISQGLVMPLEILKGKAPDEFLARPFYHMGEDVSAYLGVIKWERPEVEEKPYKDCTGTRSSVGKSPFPDDIMKTDQERVQNMTMVFNTVRRGLELGATFEVTEKLDGTSCTFCLRDNGKFDVCSRNYKLHHDGGNSIYGEIAKRYDLKNRLRAYTFLDKMKAFLGLDMLIKSATYNGLYNLAFQGEIVGPKIQGNKYKLDEIEFFVYDIFDVRNQKYLTPKQVRGICEVVGLKHVPVLEKHANLCELSIETIVSLADGTTQIGSNPKQQREGLVFKRNTERRFSFKAISNKFLLKDE